MKNNRYLLVVILSIVVYACQPSAVRETVEPHPVTEEGLIASSIYAAERTGSDAVLSNVLRRISLMKISQKEFDTALYFADGIPVQNDKDRTIADIAIAISEQGERDRARSIAPQIRSEYERSRVLSEIAVGYERAAEYRRGRELAEEIPDPNFKARTFAGIGVIYFAEGYGDLASRIFNQALQAARGEQSITHHIETLLYIAERYYEAGRPQSARDVFADVRRLAGDVRPEQHIVSVWSNILESYRKAGQGDSVIDDAIAVARAMSDTEAFYRDELHSRIASALARTGDYTQAESIAGEIGDAPLRSATYGRLAVIAHHRNDTEKAGELLSTAIELSKSLPEGPFKQRAMRDIGIHAVDIDRFDEAERLIDAIVVKHFVAEISGYAARASLNNDNRDMFNKYLKNTVAAFDDVNDPVIVSEILFDIAELYELSGHIPDENTKLIVSKALHAVE